MFTVEFWMLNLHPVFWSYTAGTEHMDCAVLTFWSSWFSSPSRNNSTSKSLHRLKSLKKSSSLLLLDEAILDLVELSQRTLTKSFKYFKSFLFTQPWWIRHDSVSVFMSRYSNYMSCVNAFTVQIRDTSRANTMVGVSHRQFSIFTDVWHHCRDSVSVQWCVVVPNRLCFRHSNFRPLP